MPCSIFGVMKGLISSTSAPAASMRFAARRTASAICGSSGSPQPASMCSATRLPLMNDGSTSKAVQSMPGAGSSE